MHINDDIPTTLDEDTPLLPEKLRSYPGVRRQVRAVAAACLGALSLGLVLGYSSPALPELQQQGLLDESQATWYGSLVTLGAMLGGPLGGIMADALGRKSSLMLNALPYTVGWLLNITNDAVLCLYVGRMLTGLAVGISSVCVPVYIAEVSAPCLRGRFGSCFQVCTTTGILLVYGLGLAVDWIWLTVMCAVVPAVMAVAMVTVPESPRWLLRHGRRHEAKVALMWLRDAHTERDLALEWVELDHGLRGGEDDGKLTMNMLSKPTIYMPFLLSVGLMFVQQFSGINAIIFYTNTIFLGAGFQGDGGTPTVIIGALQVVVTICSVFVVDRVGRRVLLIASGILMAVSCATLGIYYYLQTPALSWLSLTSLALYIAAFSIGWGPLPWVVMSELLPSKGYGLTSGIATAINWTIAFIVTKEFSAMQHALTQYGTFWFFGFVCLVGSIFTGIFLPETNGRSLQEITMSFDSY